MKILRWFENKKEGSALIGSVSVQMERPAMEFRDLLVFQKGGIRWVSPPSKQFKTKNGETKYSVYWKWVDPDQHREFQKAVLEALDEHTGKKPAKEDEPPPF